ncbi:MAG: ATP-binding protein [bacterium]
MVEAAPGEFCEPDGSHGDVALAELKTAITGAGLQPFIYRAQWDDPSRRLIGLKEFGDRVYVDLQQSIDQEFGSATGEKPDEFTEENAAMEAFIEERVQRFVLGSREFVLNELLTHANSTGGNGYVCLTGVPGSGKSALLAHLSQRLTLNPEPSTLLISHFVGASPGSTDVRRTLRRLCHELVTGAGLTAEISEDPEKLRVAFPEILQQASAQKRVVILLDAINQFDPTTQLAGRSWLPEELPATARIILSTLSAVSDQSSVISPVLAALRQRRMPPKEIALQPLTAEDAEAIIREFLHRYRKSMTDHQRAALLAKADAGTPLYLLVALEELRTLGTYEEITDRIAQLPPDTRALFIWILKRLEDDDGFRDAFGRKIGLEQVTRFVSLLGVSRHGLSQQELVDLLSPGDPQGNVAALGQLLRPYLMQRGELLDFYHGQFREAAATSYLPSESQRLAAHEQLAAYFHQKAAPMGSDKRSLTEMAFQMARSQLWQTLEETFIEFAFQGIRNSGITATADRFSVCRDCFENRKPVMLEVILHGLHQAGMECGLQLLANMAIYTQLKFAPTEPSEASRISHELLTTQLPFRLEHLSRCGPCDGNCVALSPAFDRIAIGGASGIVILDLDSAQRHNVPVALGSGYQANLLRFSESGRLLVSVTMYADRVVVIDATSGTILGTTSTIRPFAAVFSSDEESLWITGVETARYCWASGELKSLRDYKGQMHDIVYMPTDRIISAGYVSGTGEVIDVWMGPYGNPEQTIWAFESTFDHRYIASLTACKEGLLVSEATKVYWIKDLDVMTGRLSIAEFPHPTVSGGSAAVRSSPTGAWLARVTEGGVDVSQVHCANDFRGGGRVFSWPRQHLADDPYPLTMTADWMATGSLAIVQIVDGQVELLRFSPVSVQRQNGVSGANARHHPWASGFRCPYDIGLRTRSYEDAQCLILIKAGSPSGSYGPWRLACAPHLTEMILPILRKFPSEGWEECERLSFRMDQRFDQREFDFRVCISDSGSIELLAYWTFWEIFRADLTAAVFSNEVRT